MLQPFNIKKWIDENRDKLKPPVGNAQLFREADDFIIMVVGGPNSRKDYHYNESEEFFYQLEGDITVKIINKEGKPQDINIKEGEVFLLPGKTPHSPQRGANTIGIVIEKVREGGEIDGFLWYCENCGQKLYEEYFELTDIVKQLPPLMQRFYSNEDLRTCGNCGHTMQAPVSAAAK